MNAPPGAVPPDSPGPAVAAPDAARPDAFPRQGRRPGPPSARPAPAGSGAAGAAAAGRPVVAFDLDGTLVRGDSFAGFTRMLIFRNRWRAALAFLASPLFGLLFLLPPTRVLGIVGYLWIATVGLSPAEFERLAREFAASHATPDRHITAALDRLRAHQEAGDQVVVVTACAEPLASAVCAELGLTGVPVISARLRPGLGAMIPRQGCMGAGKLRRLGEAGFATQLAHAYTDSRSDVPLLRAAANRYVVSPSPRTLRRILRALPDCVVLD